MEKIPQVPSVYTTASVVVSAVFPVLAAIAVLLRCNARSNGAQRLQIDDWLIIVSWFVTLGLSLCVWIFGSQSGINFLKGNLLTAIPLETQGLFIEALLLQVCLTTIKVSILVFYKRIFSIAKWFAVAANIGIAVTTAWGLAYFFLILFQCDPISGSWTGLGVNRIPSTPLNNSQAIINIVLDLLVLLFPLPVISRLHMATKRKVGVMFIFWLGGFCVVAGICRLVFTLQGEAAAANSRSDGGYTMIAADAKASIFVLVEPNVSIIAASLPCYGPLLERGRTLDSLIRSVRGVLSIGSRGSGSRSNLSNSSKQTPKASQAGLNSSHSDGSQVELQSAGLDWTQQQSRGQTVIQTKPLGGSGNDRLGRGIAVTHTYETRNDAV